MRRVLACLIFFLSVVISPNTVFAQDSVASLDFSEGRVNEALMKTVPVRFLPGNVFYFAIRAKELVSRAFQPSSLKRAEFDSILSGKRLKEVYLLLDKNNQKNASSNLLSYSKRLQTMNKQLQKAKSQNQDVSALSSKIAESLQDQEVLLFAIRKKASFFDEQFNFDNNFKKATESFSESVFLIDSIKPGLKDRFKSQITQNQESSPSAKEDEEALPSPSVTSVPKRIIY